MSDNYNNTHDKIDKDMLEYIDILADLIEEIEARKNKSNPSHDFDKKDVDKSE